MAAPILSHQTSSNDHQQDWEVREMKQDLFKLAMQGKWDAVIMTYQERPKAHRAKITRTGDTALHIAVLDRKESVVEKLVKLINDHEVVFTSSRPGPKHPLEIANEHGNTPLHLAASIGNVQMCLCIAREHRELVGIRNLEREMPLFLAALHGKKQAFLALHDLCSGSESRHQYCRRGDGETILHCAISGEYFDLAYQIAHKYEHLINYVNESGDTPLHLLATKPAAFRSGSRPSWFNRILYLCLYVEELQEEKPSPRYDFEKITVDEKPEPEKYPRNYLICVNFFRVLVVLWNTMKIPGRQPSNRVDDPEQPQLLPPNYRICFEFIKFIYRAMLVVLGFGDDVVIHKGSKIIKKIQAKKEKHIWTVQLMNKLLSSSTEYDSSAGSQPTLKANEDEETIAYQGIYQQSINHNGANIEPKTPPKIGNDHQKTEEVKKNDETWLEKKETPILVAAKNGLVEMVERILDLFPVAIHDMNPEKKNIVLLAVENRQPHVYGLLLKREILKESIFHAVDHHGNSAAHLAAKSNNKQPWRIPGAALQMQWEIKWYKFVKNSMPMNFFVRHNKDNKTAKEIFTETHKDLVEKGGEWLNNTSNSCSVVAALIATVAFATSATVPGGVKEESGRPTLENHPAFNVFSISSLIALCFSVTAVVMFLAILTSRHEEKDFGTDLPRKLLCGLSSLFISITAILVSFCAGHFFVLKDELKYAAFPIYAVTCLPVTFFAIMQFPLYLDLISATFKKVPEKS